MDVKKKLDEVKAEFEALDQRKAQLRNEVDNIEDRQKQLQGQWQILSEMAKEEGIEVPDPDKPTEAPAEPEVLEAEPVEEAEEKKE